MLSKKVDSIIKYGSPAFLVFYAMAKDLPLHDNHWKTYAGFGIMCIAVYVFMLSYARWVQMKVTDERVTELNEAWRTRLRNERSQLEKQIEELKNS